MTMANTDTPPALMRTRTVREVAEAVAALYEIPLDELLAKRRLMHLFEPRQVVMYLARRFTRRSLEQIGIALGGRDHTTVYHGARQVEQQLVADSELRARVEWLERRLKGDI